MALLTHQVVNSAGLADVVFAAAAATGDTYKLDDDKSVLLVKNDDVAAKTATAVTPITIEGLAVADKALTVAAGKIGALPLKRGLYRNSSDGLASFTYDAVTNLKVAVVRVEV